MLEFTENGKKYYYNPETIQINDSMENNHVKSNFVYDKDKYKSKYFTNVNFILNNNCNLACVYCYANQGEYNKRNQVISFDTITEILRDIFWLCVETGESTIKVTFFGGEPLLQYELIKNTVEYAQKFDGKYGIMFIWNIVTNGTLINDDVFGFFRKYKFNVTVSIDGNKQIHDNQRYYKNKSGTYEIIKRNILKYRDSINFIVRLTINDANTKLDDAIRSIRELGVKRIVIGIDYGIKDENYMDFIKSIPKVFTNYEEDIKSGDYYIIENINRIIMNLLFKRKQERHCSAGISYYAVSADEMLYLCHRFVGRDIACFGKMSEIQIDKNLAESISRFDYYHFSKCDSECDLKQLCGGCCYYNSYKENGRISDWNKKECRFKRIIIMETFKLLVRLNIDDRRKYLLFTKEFFEKR